MVPGGFDVTSSTTRFTSRTSFVMRVEIRAMTPHGRRDQSAVIGPLARHRTQHDRMAVRSQVTLHADRTNLCQQHHRELPHVLIEPRPR